MTCTRERGAPLQAGLRRGAPGVGGRVGREDLLTGYPDALVVDLVDDARRVLHVGCGTGAASRLLAARGCAVLGVEFDEQMAAAARASGLGVDVARFEEWHPRGRVFDLVVSGHAWRWVDPASGPARAAAALGPGGRIALVGTVVKPFDGPFREVLRSSYETHAPALASSGPGLCTRPAPHETERHVRSLVLSGRFGSSAVTRYTWERSYTRSQWLQLVAAYADHAALAPEPWSDLLRAVGDAVDEIGGTLVAAHETTCTTAETPRR